MVWVNDVNLPIPAWTVGWTEKERSGCRTVASSFWKVYTTQAYLHSTFNRTNLDRGGFRTRDILVRKAIFSSPPAARTLGRTSEQNWEFYSKITISLCIPATCKSIAILDDDVGLLMLGESVF